MNAQATFSAELIDSTGTQTWDDCLSFQGADCTGGFSLWAGHTEFIALGVAGISTLYRQGGVVYLAAAQLLIEFRQNRLYLSGRRLFVDSARDRIGRQLQNWLDEQQAKREQQSAQTVQFERELVRRLLQAAKGQTQ